jgi:membrane protease YdiL (CAAX protease family)
MHYYGTADTDRQERMTMRLLHQTQQQQWRMTWFQRHQRGRIIFGIRTRKGLLRYVSIDTASYASSYALDTSVPADEVDLFQQQQHRYDDENNNDDQFHIQHQLTLSKIIRPYYESQRPVVIRGGVLSAPSTTRWQDWDYWWKVFGGNNIVVDDDDDDPPLMVSVEMGGSYGITTSERGEIPITAYLQYIGMFDDDGHGKAGSLEDTSTSIAIPSSELVYLAQNDLPKQLQDDFIIPDFCHHPFTTTKEEEKGSEGEQQRNGDDLHTIGLGRLYSTMKWLGPRGCVSPLHYDPLDNCSCQYVGRKRVILYEPSSSQHSTKTNQSMKFFWRKRQVVGEGDNQDHCGDGSDGGKGIETIRSNGNDNHGACISHHGTVRRRRPTLRTVGVANVAITIVTIIAANHLTTLAFHLNNNNLRRTFTRPTPNLLKFVSVSNDGGGEILRNRHTSCDFHPSLLTVSISSSTTTTLASRRSATTNEDDGCLQVRSLPKSTTQQHQQKCLQIFSNRRSNGISTMRTTKATATSIDARKSNINDDDLYNKKDDIDTEFTFDASTVIPLILGQASLILVAIGAAAVLGTPNFGFGPTGFDLMMTTMTGSFSSLWSSSAIIQGIIYTIPLGIMVGALEIIENQWNIKVLKDVEKATNRSVLSILGGSFLPVVGLATATGLGVAAGIGEEMLFRGVLQYELLDRIGNNVVAVGLSSVIFGALHAVTPLYAGLATLASVYFGWLYLVSGNLVVPIVTHAVYDIFALYFAHWTVSKMTIDEKRDLASFDAPFES